MQNQRSQSRRDEFERARQERVRREAERGARRLRGRRLKQLAAVLVTAVVVVGVMVATSGGGSVQPPLADTQAVTAELVGVPQADMTLGKPNAVVTIHEYSDLQCTACSAFATGILPAVIDKLVKTGAAKLAFHNWTIIDQTDSVEAAEASYAAGRQGRAWQFIELFYGNQGEERSGHVTDAFLDRLAKAAGLDVARFDSDRRTAAVAARVREDGHQALAHGFRGTPSFAVSGPRGTRVLAGGAPDSIQPFDDAIRTVS
jgi:protein-disulfide isomerase